MKKHIILFISLSLILSLSSSAQKNRIIELTGKIINEKDNSPVHYAMVMNIKKGKGVACDSLGFFHITILEDDILKINALGFEREYFSLKDTAVNENEIFIIKLREKTYKLSNVDIYEARWKDFEFEFIHTETEKQETKERIEKWFYTLIDPKELALITASTAIGIPINFKTKQDKQKIKVESFLHLNVSYPYLSGLEKVHRLKSVEVVHIQLNQLWQVSLITFLYHC